MTTNPYQLLETNGVSLLQLSEQGKTTLKQYDQAAKLAWRNPELKELQTELEKVGKMVVRLLQTELEKSHSPNTPNIPAAPEIPATPAIKPNPEHEECDRLFGRLAQLRDNWQDEHPHMQTQAPKTAEPK